MTLTDRPDPSALRWLIGAELRNYRNRARLTVSQLVERTGLVRGKVSSMEAGRHTQYPADIAKYLTACMASEPDIDRLSSLAGKTDEKSWWAPYAHVLPDWNRTYVGLEGLAARMFTYEPVFISGLLQSPEYADVLTEAGGFVRADQADRFVEFRQARAERLIAPESLELHAILEDGALRRLVSGPEVMKRQYQHLAELAERDNITIQIVRPDDGPHAAAQGQFTLLDFDKAQSVAFVEHVYGGIYVQDHDEVRTYRMVAENLERVAMTPDKSRKLIHKLASQ